MTSGVCVCVGEWTQVLGRAYYSKRYATNSAENSLHASYRAGHKKKKTGNFQMFMRITEQISISKTHY